MAKKKAAAEKPPVQTAPPAPELKPTDVGTAPPEATEPEAASEAPEASAPAPIAARGPTPVSNERRYAGQEVLDSDLFKLSLSKFKRNVAFTGHEAEFVSIEHVHFYRTLDSSGRVQQYSGPVGGHFHEVKTEPNPNGGVPIIVSVGPPLKKINTIKNKRIVTSIVPIGADDTHTHEIGYIRSDKVKQRQYNARAQSWITTNEQRQNPPMPLGAAPGKNL